MSEEKVALVLVKEGLCASPDEAADTVSGMMMMLLSQQNSSSSPLLWETPEAFADAITACFEVEEDVVRSMYDAIQDNDENNSDSDEASVRSAPSVTEMDEDDDGMYIGEGECELCEREISLTRHHLIPRSTWPRLEPRLLNAFATALEYHDNDKAEMIAGDGLKHLLADYCHITTSSSAQLIDRATQRHLARQMLQRVCLICRQCHTAVHRAHDNMTLAAEYNTVDKLIHDPAIYKFCKWASKQKISRKYAVRK
eukprot:scaffold9695_cov181-Amphora_coffeaeformis.AAC.5